MGTGEESAAAVAAAETASAASSTPQHPALKSESTTPPMSPTTISATPPAVVHFEPPLPSPPCGAAFLRRLHTDPNATHVTLPSLAGATPTELSAAPSKPDTPTTTPGTPEGAAGGSPSFILPAQSAPPQRPAAMPIQPKHHSDPMSPPPRPTIATIDLESPLSPKSMANPLEAVPPALPGNNARLGPTPVRSSTVDHLATPFQERMDALANGNGSANGDRSASFADSSDSRQQLELNIEPAGGRRTSWNDFAVAYCNGRFDPLRIPNPPDFDDGVTPETRVNVMRPQVHPKSAPSSTQRQNRSYQNVPTQSNSSPSVITTTTMERPATPTSPTTSTRTKAFELESLPNRPRQRPPKLALPAYKVAAATVRIASSSLPDSMFAPLSVPSPERELLDPLASLVSPPIPSSKGSATSDPGSGSSPTFVWNRSKSSVLPAGTPTHETLPTIQASPANTPGAERSALPGVCCGAVAVAADPPVPGPPDASKGGVVPHLKSSIPPASAPLPRRPEAEAEDYFGANVPIGPEIKEPAVTVPVPETTAFPLIHHPHQLRPFYEKYGFLPAPMPPREAERRKALYNFNILHTAADLNFDRIVHMVKLVFNTRMVFLSLIDSDAQWYKSQTGFGGSHSPRVTGFCGHTLLVDSDEPFVVLDTHLDWRFARNPHVVGEPWIRFYAGTPLRTSDGLNLGSLCLVDDKPRTEFTPRSRHILKEFAAIVMREMELWRDKLQLRTRDKIQTSMENFTRECLEIDDKLSSTNFEAASRMGQVYSRAAKLVHQTLELDGCAILDISQFERGEVDLPDGTKKVVYHANPYHESQSVLKRLQTFGPVSAFPVLASTPGEVQTRALTPLEHERMSIFLGDQRDGRIFENIAPSWIRYIFPPSLKYGMVVPVIGIDGQPFALICAHTHDKGKQFLEGYELQFLRAIGVIILSAVLRRRMILADRSKSVLISSVSHELRTPLHGILAATELLNDSPLDTNQAAFLSTVKTCGMQLIETVNHVLDFTKLSSEKGGTGRRATQLTQVDLADLVEQTVESCFVGQRSRYMQTNDDQLGSFYSPVPMGLLPYDQRVNVRSRLSLMESVVDIGLRKHGWNVMVDPGSLRRIVMNLYGNSLKFTKEGFVQVSLRELPHEPHAKRIPVELMVVDTGKGIGKSFLKDQLFEPFTQENPLQPGTGLGLAIVNSIVRSDVVQGKVDVWSAEGVGTQIKVTFDVELASDPEQATDIPEHQMASGYKVAFLGFDTNHRGLALVHEVIVSYASFMGFAIVKDPAEADLLVVNEFVKKETEEQFRNTALILVATFKTSDAQTLVAMGRNAYTGLVYKPVGPAKVIKELKAAIKFLKHPSRANSGLSSMSSPVSQLRMDSDGDSVVLRPPSAREQSSESVRSAVSTLDLPRPKAEHRILLQRRRSDERELGHTQSRPPLAPRGLTYHAVPTLASVSDLSPTSSISSPVSAVSGRSTISLADGGAMLKAAARPEVSGARRPARVLVVEDNVINRRVLTAFLKKRGYEYAEAVNGAAGVELFDITPSNHWDVILMDITMPVMNGYDATRSIRRIETSRRRSAADQVTQALNLQGGGTVQARAQSISPAAKIFALTGLATDDDKRQAFDSGVDGYLVKPVSLASLDLLFTKIGF